MTLFQVISWLDDNNKCYTMKNVSQKKGLGADTNLDHVEPNQIPLIK